MEEFRAAAGVFWTAYSAYARAVPVAAREELLRLLSTDSNASWHRMPEFKIVWRERYDRMLFSYMEKVRDYGDRFLKSPAGLAMKTELDKGRRNHTTLPNVNEETITKYKGADGISWGMKEIADFFEILCEWTGTEPFESSV